MSDLKSRIDELAAVMQEFGLEEAKLCDEGWSIEFSKCTKFAPAAAIPAVPSENQVPAAPVRQSKKAPAAAVVQGTPVTTPMMGIFYSSPSPGAPPFVKEGDSVTQGQVIALIEAMKVYNEIFAPISGRILKVKPETGALVQAGETLILIG